MFEGYGKHFNKMLYMFNEDKIYNLSLILIALVFIFTRTYLLTSVPLGMHVDEAGMAYDAYSIANYGVDRYLNRYPVYLINFGGGQSALYAYLAAVLIKFFGYSLTIVRIPAILGGTLVLIFGYLITKEVLGRRCALLSAILITICPYFIMASRRGLDCNLLLGFCTASIYYIIKAVDTSKIKYYIISAIFFGITLYTYVLSYIIIPIFLAILFIYLIKMRRIKIVNLIAFGGVISLFALPLILMIFVNKGYINQISTSYFTIPKLKSYRGSEISIHNIIGNIKLMGILLSKDWLPYNAFNDFGTVYYISIPLVLVGIICAVKSFVNDYKIRKINYMGIIIFWFISVILCGLIIKKPNINKCNAIYFAIIFFIALSINNIVKKYNLFISVLAILYTINFGMFFNYYYYKYPSEVKTQHLFDYSLIPSIEQVMNESKNFAKRNIYIDTKGISNAYIYTLLATKTSPYEFQNTLGDKNSFKNFYFYFPKDVDENGVYFIKDNKDLEIVLKNKQFEFYENNGFRIYYRE